jgi:threonine synthase
MKYFSTSANAPLVSFKEACIKGQAPDRGLYCPEHIPQLPEVFFRNISGYSIPDMAMQVMQPYVGDDIPVTELYQILKESINFPVPLVPVTPSIDVLEMFHGRTLAFKDLGARFMSRCLGYFVKNMQRKITVLVATSGDTGGAVADGFLGVDGIQVVILFPSGKVSKVQEKQLTSMGENVYALEVEGSFDDCQQMVKSAFMDSQLNEHLFLTSANSINIARWLPQQLFYFIAYQQWKDAENAPVIAVPSGNFGNICAGLLAMKSGLPVRHFIAACNANDTVPDFLETGVYRARQSQPTISNAMDVGDPSNFLRILKLFNEDITELKTQLSAISISDKETADAMKELYEQYGYLADPHGAVGYLALKKYLMKNPDQKGLFAETAHPVKFFDTVEQITGAVLNLPAQIEELMKRNSFSTRMKVSFEDLKDYLISLPV